MQSNQTTSEHDSASSRSHDMVATTINFSGAKQRSVESKTRKRVLNRRNDLLTLIQLDFNSFDLFDLAPVTEYNFYIKNFGSQNSGQASTQCNDDAIEIEIQTDQPEVGDRWSQHPPDGAIACGGTTVTEDSPHLRMLAAMRDDSNRFSEFLVYASDIIDSSFEEALLWRGNKPNSFTPITSCDASTKFNTNIPYLHGRKILHTIFGNGMIAVTFGGACHDVTTRIDQRGIITVWKVSNNEQPYRILICDASPVTCCFAHNKKILFVGTDDGCVLLYDLTEPTTMHQQMELEKNMMTVMRNATYTTGWQNEIHTSPIVCLGSVGSFENMSQLFSIDESARLCVWVVVDIISDVDDDVGLVPHGRVKLVKSSVINVISNKPSSSGLGGSATFAVCPDSNTFYVGTDLGDVISCTRENKTRTYNLPGNKSSVTSISFNQFISTLMLVSYKSGDIALFMLDRDTPVISWPLDGTSILSCDWSNSRPSVFFSLDSTNHLQVWDLMAMDAAPVSDDSFEQKVICFSVDGHSQKSTNLLVAFDSCEFEILKMKSHFVNSVSTDEVEQMTSLVQSFG
nr:WD repeat-containing protein 60-like [Ciona intestinalis]|eukprot:XP_004226364.3 WD repeat-containing protein 60-like [Ciona intestinalis]